MEMIVRMVVLAATFGLAASILKSRNLSPEHHYDYWGVHWFLTSRAGFAIAMTTLAVFAGAQVLGLAGAL
ncbi:MAG TPA: hypothetical protein VNM92_03935 [Thermoanaerobaculia bacterium]|nr:hypothetical protein [Thermoanaerobaculia bacterium]